MLAERQSRRRQIITIATPPVGIAYATAVSGRVIAHHAVATDTNTSQRARRSSRQFNSAHHPTTHVAAVVVCEKYDGRNPCGTGASVHTSHVSTATSAVASRRAMAKRNPAVTPASRIGTRPGLP